MFTYLFGCHLPCHTVTLVSPALARGLLKVSSAERNILGASVTASRCHYKARGSPTTVHTLSLLCLFASHLSTLFASNKSAVRAVSPVVTQPGMVPVTHSTTEQGCQQTEPRSCAGTPLPGLSSRAKLCPVHHQFTLQLEHLPVTQPVETQPCPWRSQPISD